MKIKLSNRLAAVAEKVPQGATVADIGTDHGYLAVYLVVEGISPSIVATDRAKGPLASAKQLVELLSLSHKIDMRLGDGLAVLKPGEVNTVCIAGMGGMAIIDILKEQPEVVNQTQRFIFQPMRGASNLRKYLVENGFQIIDEDLAIDDGFYYEVIVAEAGQMTLNDDEAEFGPLLLSKRHPLLLGFLELKKADLERLLEGMAQNNSEESLKRKEQLTASIAQMQRVIEDIKDED